MLVPASLALQQQKNKKLSPLLHTLKTNNITMMTSPITKEKMKLAQGHVHISCSKHKNKVSKVCEWVYFVLFYDLVVVRERKERDKRQ